MSLARTLLVLPAVALAGASLAASAATAQASTSAAPATSTLTVTLRSDLYAGRAATARIGVNGVQVASITTTTSWRTVRVDLGRTLTASDEVEVFYDNDAAGRVHGTMQDRNLYARGIVVDGIQAPATATTFDAGDTWDEATDSLDLGAGREKLATNGALRFRAAQMTISTPAHA